MVALAIARLVMLVPFLAHDVSVAVVTALLLAFLADVFRAAHERGII